MHVNHDQLKKFSKNRWLKICFTMTVWKNNDWSREINHFFSTWPEYLRVLFLICSHEIIFCEVYWGGDERKISIHSSSNHDFFYTLHPIKCMFFGKCCFFFSPHTTQSNVNGWMVNVSLIVHFSNQTLFWGWKARFRSKKGKKN